MAFFAPAAGPSRRWPLNVTSLVDILVCLSVYLLLGYVPSSERARELEDVVLPSGRFDLGMSADLVRIAVSFNALRLGDDVLVELDYGQLPLQAYDEDLHIAPLLQALERAKMEQLTHVSRQAHVGAPNVLGEGVYVQAARGLPFAVVEA